MCVSCQLTTFPRIFRFRCSMARIHFEYGDLLSHHIIDGLCNPCVFPFASLHEECLYVRRPDSRTNADLPLPLFRLIREILAEKPGEETYVSLITARCLCSSLPLSCHHKIMSESGDAPRCYFEEGLSSHLPSC